MSEPDIVGLGVAIVDVVLCLEHMPRWEDPGAVSGFALADGRPAGTACAVPAMLAWDGTTDNSAGQGALYHRAKMNGLASLGQWPAELEEVERV